MHSLTRASIESACARTEERCEGRFSRITRRCTAGLRGIRTLGESVARQRGMPAWN